MSNQQLQIQGQSESVVTRTGGTFFDPCASERHNRIGDNNLVVGMAIDLFAAIAVVAGSFLLVFSTNWAGPAL